MSLSIDNPQEQMILYAMHAQNSQIMRSGEVKPIRQSMRIIEISILKLKISPCIILITSR